MTMAVNRSGGILFKDNKVLVERSKGKNFFIPPGGRIENDETPKQALVRELMEELKIVVKEENLKEFGKFTVKGGGQENYDVVMYMFLVESWDGEITIDNEVEEILWIDSNPPQDVQIGSIFQQEVIPQLKLHKLID